ncbi:MAG: DUF397 domain-containing protein [Sciscionella sp.]
MSTAFQWRKSSHSSGTNACVEIAQDTMCTYVRDTKNRAAGALTFAANEWAAFLQAARKSHR